MIFPKEKMRLLETYSGKESEAGWLELNVAAVDIEGASKVLINLDEVAALKLKRSNQSDALEEARKLLGGD